MSIEDQEYLNRDPAPVGKLLTYWKAATAERIEMAATLGLLREEQREYGILVAELQRTSDYVELLLDQIEDGELTDTEAVLYQRILAGEEDEDDDDDGDDDASVGHTPTQQFIIGQLRAAGGSADIDDLVKDHYGIRLTEFDRRHSRIRQAVARLAWPDVYSLPGPAVVTVELPANRINGVVRLIDDGVKVPL